MLTINKIIFFLFLLFLPITAFAYSPAHSPEKVCNGMQSKLTQWFHDCGSEYNSEGHSPQIDTDSPSVNYQSAIKFLKDNEYIKDEFFKVNENCEYDLKYLATGTKLFPDHHNIFYCKFHGSYDCNIHSFYPKELEKENLRHISSNRLTSFLFHNSGFLFFCIIIFVAIIICIWPTKKGR